MPRVHLLTNLRVERKNVFTVTAASEVREFFAKAAAGRVAAEAAKAARSHAQWDVSAEETSEHASIKKFRVPG